METPIENEEFQKRVRFNEIFFKYFKGSTDLYNNIIITKNEYKIRLYKRFPESMVLVTIMVKRDSYYTSENDCKKIIIDKEKYIDIKCIFTEKNNYEVNIKANDGRSKSFINAVTYKIQYLDESEKQFNYGEINYKESRPLEHDEIIASLNKEKIKLIVYKATERKKSSLKLFIEYLKEETKYLNEFEKAYTLFFWIFKNLSYEKSTSNLKEDEYEKIYKEEKLDISYSKYFNYILKNIGLNVFEINGFTKNSSKYIYPNQILGYNTSWNILEVKGNYYIIYSSIYFSYITIEELVDFYFCAKPEHFIWAFLPKYPKWQLLEKSMTTIEFQNRVFLLSHNFFFILIQFSLNIQF